MADKYLPWSVFEALIVFKHLYLPSEIAPLKKHYAYWCIVYLHFQSSVLFRWTLIYFNKMRFPHPEVPSLGVQWYRRQSSHPEKSPGLLWSWGCFKWKQRELELSCRAPCCRQACWSHSLISYCNQFVNTLLLTLARHVFFMTEWLQFVFVLFTKCCSCCLCVCFSASKDLPSGKSLASVAPKAASACKPLAGWQLKKTAPSSLLSSRWAGWWRFPHKGMSDYTWSHTNQCSSNTVGFINMWISAVHFTLAGCRG